MASVRILILKRAALATWIAFALLAIAIKAGWTLAFDTWLILALRGALPDVTGFLRACSWLAGNGAAYFALPLLLYFAVRRGRSTAWRYTIACLGGWLLNLVLKQVFQQTRPNGISPKLTEAGWLSFPSGHAMLGALIFGFGAVLIAQALAGAARAAVIASGLVITLLIGVSRIYLGAHWPSDVLGAWLAAAGWAILCTILDLTRPRTAA